MRTSAKARTFILSHSLSEVADAINGGSIMVYPMPQIDIEEAPVTEPIGVVDEFHFVADGERIRNEGPVTVRFIRSQEVEGLYFRMKLKDDLGVMDGLIGANFADLNLNFPIYSVEQEMNFIVPDWKMTRD